MILAFEEAEDMPVFIILNFINAYIITSHI